MQREQRPKCAARGRGRPVRAELQPSAARARRELLSSLDRRAQGVLCSRRGAPAACSRQARRVRWRCHELVAAQRAAGSLQECYPAQRDGQRQPLCRPAPRRRASLQPLTLAPCAQPCATLRPACASHSRLEEEAAAAAAAEPGLRAEQAGSGAQVGAQASQQRPSQLGALWARPCGRSACLRRVPARAQRVGRGARAAHRRGRMHGAYDPAVRLAWVRAAGRCAVARPARAAHSGGAASAQAAQVEQGRGGAQRSAARVRRGQPGEAPGLCGRGVQGLGARRRAARQRLQAGGRDGLEARGAGCHQGKVQDALALAVRPCSQRDRRAVVHPGTRNRHCGRAQSGPRRGI